MITLYNSQLLPQYSDEIEFDFPAEKEMKTICKDLLPDLNDAMNAMGEQELKGFFSDVVCELKRDAVKDKISFDYLKMHPFEIRRGSKAELNLNPSEAEIMEVIRVKDE